MKELAHSWEAHLAHQGRGRLKATSRLNQSKLCGLIRESFGSVSTTGLCSERGASQLGATRARVCCYHARAVARILSCKRYFCCV
ncbi:hypothetical protein HYC85_029371 [Camellia sinensis]|uniref:Uncharacterized protein n=1 Tax=Camellia sinensis TaxID=4442 RepID=A0A7J7FXU8_CAMSI|nr:hypothetical protein HYC85_029371 [Camellia sinensis]